MDLNTLQLNLMKSTLTLFIYLIFFNPLLSNENQKLMQLWQLMEKKITIDLKEDFSNKNVSGYLSYFAPNSNIDIYQHGKEISGNDGQGKTIKVFNGNIFGSIIRARIPAKIMAKTLFKRLAKQNYKNSEIQERHRHRFEFNNDYKKEVFPLPEPIILKKAARIMSLRDGTKKMSKSDTSEFSRISLMDSNDDIDKKIKKAKTDALPIPSSLELLESMPEAKNLITIYSACENEEFETSFKRYREKNFSVLKSDLTEVLINKIGPIRDEMKKLVGDRKYLVGILDSGSDRAQRIASDVLKEVYDVTGLNL